MSIPEFNNHEISSNVNSNSNGNGNGNVMNGCFNNQSNPQSTSQPSHHSEPLLEVTNIGLVQKQLNSSNPTDHSVLPSLHEFIISSSDQQQQQQQQQQQNHSHSHSHSHSQPQSPNPNLTNYNNHHSNHHQHQQQQQQQPSISHQTNSYQNQNQSDKPYHLPDLHSQQHHQQHHHHHHQQARHQHQNRINQIGFSPSTFAGSSSDRAHSPPANWSHSQRSHHLNHNDPNQLRHRSISLSTPTSSHSSNNLEHAPSHSLGRILPLPYALASPELPHIESQPALHITSLPELDHRYHHHHHHHLGASTSNPRRYSQKLLPGSYDTYPPYEYPTSIPPSNQLPQIAFDFNSRLPSSPSHSLYRSISHRTFDQQLNHSTEQSHGSGSGIGQKRKLVHSPLDHAASPPFKRQNSHQPAPKVIPIPQAKEAGHQRMTTILCLHASVAQKSYGQEKRFLCPPPLVRITGPYRQLPKYNRPILSMSILNEEGDRHLSQTAYLGEEDSNVHFKSLHISGAAKKAKHVTLELSLHPPSTSPNHNIHGIGPDVNELAPPVATFTSDECNIISKPSKKTAKARNTQSCIFNGSTICLFNRINSQTVRTKYLCVEQGQLAARASQWSAFTINVVRRAEDAGLDGSPPLATKTLLSSSIPGADRTVTYGSEVELIDFVTGVSSGPLVVRKVEKNKVQKDATGPISQMQKLAFCKVDRNDGSAIYVSALEPGRFPSPTELGSPFEMSGGNELNGMSYGQACPQAPPPSLHALQYQAPRATLPPEERGGTTLDEIDDSVAWTVIGVAHFSHTFFDLSHNYPQIPHEPITPLPVIISRPEIELEAMTLTMSLTGFFDAEARPMEIWMGPIGPLPVNVIGTTGITLASDHASTGGSVRLQMNGRSRQETMLVVSLPAIEMMYWTLHGKEMRGGTMIVLDESNKMIGELIGKRADSVETAIPALPITVIRPDGMSFVMAYSICLVENESAHQHHHHHGFGSDGSAGAGTGQGGEDERSGGPVCILKVI